jgi:hypothetical protein
VTKYECLQDFCGKPEGRCPIELLWFRYEVIVKMYVTLGSVWT